MGRIKTKLLKRITQQLISRNKDAFTDDFARNKEILKNYLDVNSQKIANVIAGYLTKLVKLNKTQK